MSNAFLSRLFPAGALVIGAAASLGFQTSAEAINTFTNEDFGNIASLTVASGQTFGFIVETANNDGDPGVFTVTNFHATPVPLETDAYLLSSAPLFSAGASGLNGAFKDATAALNLESP